jgi:hypothetical protein
MAVLEWLEGFAAETLLLAEAKCRGGYPDRGECSWYHGAWPTLRVLGLVSNPYWHWHFYRAAFVQALDGIAHPNVLVLGAADFSMPYLVQESVAADITVSDICDTPLALSRRLSGQQGFGWRTLQLDARNPPRDLSPVDMVTMDAFLTRFAQAEKRSVLDRTKSLLKAGGRMVTTVRLGELEGDQSKSGSGLSYQSNEDRRIWFVERAESRAHERGGIRGVSAERVRGLAEAYMRDMKSYRFANSDDVRSTFISAGFSIESLECVVVPGESEEAIYGRVVARSI